MKAKTCYVIKEGEFYSSLKRTVCVCKRKKTANKICKADGFTYSTEDELWFGIKWNTQYYREIIPIDFYD